MGTASVTAELTGRNRPSHLEMGPWGSDVPLRSRRSEPPAVSAGFGGSRLSTGTVPPLGTSAAAPVGRQGAGGLGPVPGAGQVGGLPGSSSLCRGAPLALDFPRSLAW